MAYRLRWYKSARNRLAQAWLDSTERTELAKAVDAVETKLRQRPIQLGESRGGNRRIVIENNFAISYYIIEDDATVTVTNFDVF